MFNVEFPINNKDFVYLDLSKTYPTHEVREKQELWTIIHSYGQLTIAWTIVHRVLWTIVHCPCPCTLPQTRGEGKAGEEVGGSGARGGARTPGGSQDKVGRGEKIKRKSRTFLLIFAK